MARTALTPNQLLGSLSASYATASAATFNGVTIDNTNGNSVPVSGRDLIVVWNPDASAHTVTITSAPDYDGRTSDIAAYSLAQNDHVFFGPLLLDGWRHADGNIYLTSNSALLKVAVLRVPGV